MRAAPDGREAVAYRQLRARLRRRGDPQVIGLVGEGPRAGTMVAAANLALAFTEGRRRAVALVDGSCGSPSLRRLLRLRGRPDGEGEGARPSGAAARVVDCLPPVDVVLGAGGSGDGAPGSAALARLLGALRERYAYVVVALAPECEPAPPVDALLVVSRGAAGALRIVHASSAGGAQAPLTPRSSRRRDRGRAWSARRR
jgi:hypothetical protein